MTLIQRILLVYVCLLQFKGVSPETVFINHFSRAGQDVTLPCDRATQQGPTCSRVDWIYNRDPDRSAVTEVRKGKVEKNSPRSSRLRLNTDCSLTVHNVTGEDSGLYTCRLFDDDSFDTVVYLSVLSVSPTEPQLNGLMRLTCTLKRYSELDPCGQNSFHWLDETGTVLSGAGITQNNCVSYLTVERQSEHRKHTCQYVDKNTVLISADYTPEVNREGKTVSSGSPGSTELFIGVGAVVSLLVLLVVGVVVFFKIRAKRSAAETTEDTEGDVNPGDSAVDLENNVTYARINHQKAPEKTTQVVMEENTVTYSAVNIKTEPDSSSIYSKVNKTKV